MMSIILAPTGVAAKNIQRHTIHRYISIPRTERINWLARVAISFVLLFDLKTLLPKIDAHVFLSTR